MDKHGKDSVTASDVTEDFISKQGIVLDGDPKKFAEWYLEMTKDLEPLDDIEDDDD